MHTAPITSITMNPAYLVTASDDGMIVLRYVAAVKRPEDRNIERVYRRSGSDGLSGMASGCGSAGSGRDCDSPYCTPQSPPSHNTDACTVTVTVIVTATDKC